MANEHIPTSEIQQDIHDTQIEIEKMTREIRGLELLGDRMSLFKRDARFSGISERRLFIEKLQSILSARDK